MRTESFQDTKSLGLWNILGEWWVGEGWTARPATLTSHSKHSCSNGWLKPMLNPYQDWGLGEGKVCERHEEQREFNLTPCSSLLSQIRPVLSGMRKSWKPGCDTFFWNANWEFHTDVTVKSLGYRKPDWLGCCVFVAFVIHSCGDFYRLNKCSQRYKPFQEESKNLRAPLLPSLCCIYCSQNSRKQHLQNQL